MNTRYDLSWLRRLEYRQVFDAWADLIAEAQGAGEEDMMLADMGRQDRYFLLVHLLKRRDAVHPWLYERCREVEAQPYWCLDLWARGHYKSTFITFAGTIQEILRDPEVTIGIFSHTRPIAKAFLGQIALELEQNTDLQQIYPDVLWSEPRRQAPRWSLDSGIIVRRRGNPKESTVEAWGVVDGQPTSKHFGILLYDDIVTEESVSTPEQVEKTTRRLELSYNLGTKGGSRQYVGTRYSYADTYRELLARQTVVPRIHPATDDGTINGTPVFLTPEQWEKKRRDESSYVIACQQLQNPVAGQDQDFKPEWVRYWEVRPLTLSVAILCDPAGVKPSSASASRDRDRAAFAVIGIDAHRNKYLLDGACHRMPLAQRWEMLRRLWTKWTKAPGIQTVKAGYERYGMQSDIEHFEEMMRIEGLHFPISELAWPREGGGSKEVRIKRLQPDFENWRFFLPHRGEPTRNQRAAIQDGRGALVAKPIRRRNEHNEVYDLVAYFLDHEYLLFPFAPHEDLFDAMSRIYDIDLGTPRHIDTQRDLEPEPDTEEY